MQSIKGQLEFTSYATQADYQLTQFNSLMNYVMRHSKFYQHHFKDFISNPLSHINEIDTLPFTTKQDLQQHNQDFICIEKNEIAEYNITSGTDGQPIYIALSNKDLERLAYNEKLSFEQIVDSQTVQLMLTLDKQFMAGMAYYQGAVMANKTVIRTGPGLPAMQWDNIFKYQVDTLVAVPSFILKLKEFAQQHGIEFQLSPVKNILCIGESISNENLEKNILAENILQNWNVKLYSTYASTEMQHAFTECRYSNGGHLHPELLILELIDENDQVITSSNTIGEVVITTLNVTGTPLIRYKTGDLCKAYFEPCGCGRTTVRLGSILGRKNQLLKFKGTSLYPNTIIEILNEIKQIKGFQIVVTKNKQEQDHVLLKLESCVDNIETKQILLPVFQHKLRVVPEIEIVSSTTLQQLLFPNGNRKPLQFLDLR